MRNRSLLRASLLGLLMAATALAGCMGVGGGDEKEERQSGENAAPEAKLAVDGRDTRWNGEQFHFDGSGSKDDDGSVERWRFDFGDGSEMTIERSEDTDDVSHAYLNGGEYLVTLTVTDDGGENAGTLTDTDTVTVNVNEEQTIANQVLYAPPSSASPPSKFTHGFNVTDDADSVDAMLNFRSTVPVGSSEIVVRILDPDNEILEEKTVTLAAGAEKSEQLTSDLVNDGTHHLEVEAKSGGATMDGTLRIYYEEGEQR